MALSPDPMDGGRGEFFDDLRRSDLRRGRVPPSFHSGRVLVMWIAGITAVLAVLALALARVDSQMLDDVREFRAVGWTDLPGNSANVAELLAFAAQQRVNCTTPQDLADGAGECARILAVARRVNDYKSDLALVWSFIVVGVVALFFPFTMFTHQASSNLRFLRLEGQRFSPGWAVGWFFIPIANIVQPARVYRELVQASDSTETSDPRSWQNARRPGMALVGIWWSLVVAAVLFGPRGISLFVGRGEIDDWVRAGRWLVWSDLFQVAPLVLTAMVVYRLQRAQESRHALIGRPDVAGQTRSGRQS